MSPEKFDSNPLEDKINKPGDGTPDTNPGGSGMELYAKQQEKLKKISDASDLQGREDQKDADRLLAGLESDSPDTTPSVDTTPSDNTALDENKSIAHDDYDAGIDEYVNSDGEYFV